LQYGFTCRDPCGRFLSAIKSSPAYPTIEKDYIRAADSHPTPGCRTIKRKLDHQWAQAAICRCEVAALSWRQVLIHSSTTGQSLTGQLSNNAKSFDQDKISSHTGGLYRHIGNIAASFTHREEKHSDFYRHTGFAIKSDPVLEDNFLVGGSGPETSR